MEKQKKSEEERVKYVNKKLSEAYFDPESSVGFGGLSALQKYGKTLGITGSETRRWLSGQKNYQKFKPIKRRINRHRTFVDGLDEQWQADLIVLENFAKENRGYAYILICIDILSRHVFATPLKNKDAITTMTGLKKIFDTSQRKPLLLQTDEGGEFMGAHFQAFLKHHGIRHFYTHQDTKSAIVERVIRTIMGRLWKSMSFFDTGYKWVELLPKVVHGYNNSEHRTIGIAPKDVTVENSRDVWRYLFSKTTEKPQPEGTQQSNKLTTGLRLAEEGENQMPAKEEKKKEKKKKMRKKVPQFKVGDRVWVIDRKRLKRNAFEKGYKSKWKTDETFIVSSIFKGHPVAYRLVNESKEPVPGRFYEEQLQKI